MKNLSIVLIMTVSVCLVASAKYAAADFIEIPKDTMQATASSSLGGNPASNVLDDDPNTFWRSNWEKSAWLRIDLGQDYVVGRFDIMNISCRQSPEDYIKDYHLYVTGDPNNWGEPVDSGTMQRSTDRHQISFAPKIGRYVVISATTTDSSVRIPGCSEVWVLGAPVDPVVTTFAVADTSSGSHRYTNDSTVTVTAFGSSASYDPDTEQYNAVNGWMITQSDTPPTLASGPEGESWLTEQPTSYPLRAGTDYGLVTLYAWVKDTGDGISSFRSTSILYQPDPDVSNINIETRTDLTAAAYWQTDVDAYGMIEYRVLQDPPAGNWTATAWETTYGRNHSRRLLSLALETTYEIRIHSNEIITETTYAHLPTGKIIAAEIDKNIMTATASSSYSNDPINWGPQFAIDGNYTTGNGWLASGGVGSWLRIDLGEGALYMIQQFGYIPRSHVQHGAITEFEIYVTDSESNSFDQWGEPSAYGPWPATFSRKEAYLKLNSAGRYVILRAISFTGNPGALEVWIHGYSLRPSVSSFAVADAETLSPQFTNTPLIAITSLAAAPAVGATIEGWLISESPEWPEPVTAPWEDDPPGTYEITGPAGDVTLYAYVVDSEGIMGRRTTSIYYQPVHPQASNVRIVPESPTTAWVIWDTQVSAFTKAEWTPQDAENWTGSAWTATHGTTHQHRISGLTPDSLIRIRMRSNKIVHDAINYHFAAGYHGWTEIPKTAMSADASSVYDNNYELYGPDNAINDISDDHGWLSGGHSGSWLRISLDDYYTVQKFGYIARSPLQHGAITAYEIYVTDVDSTNYADWGEPVSWGNWVATLSYVQYAVLPPCVKGKYVILRAITSNGNPGAAEIWIYGHHTIADFEVTGSTGDSRFTRDDYVTVTAFEADPPGEALVEAWAITQNSTAPVGDEWTLGGLPVAPFQHNFDENTPEGLVTLYAWVKYDSEETPYATQTILYSTKEPVVRSYTFTPDDPDNPQALTVSWTIDSPAYGDLAYLFSPSAGMGDFFLLQAGSYGTQHQYTFLLDYMEEGDFYYIKLINNGAETEVIWPGPDMIWCTPGDANGDGVVNVLDLIFVRNKLGQDVEGENVYADLNHDGTIDILDLMIVRENLGNSCSGE